MVVAVSILMRRAGDTMDRFLIARVEKATAAPTKTAPPAMESVRSRFVVIRVRFAKRGPLPPAAGADWMPVHLFAL